MPEPLNLLDTDSYIEKCLLLFFFYCLSHFISIGDPALVQSEMILSFLYPQFNIDVYIPIYNIYAPLSFLSFFLCNLKYSNGRFFFLSYLLFFRLKTEESFIMIWIAFIWITPFSFSFYYSPFPFLFFFISLKWTL